MKKILPQLILFLLLLSLAPQAQEEEDDPECGIDVKASAGNPARHPKRSSVPTITVG